jgi:hypothetical protein
MAYVAGETGFATLSVCVVSAVVLLRRAKVWHSSENPQVTTAPQPVTAA